MDISSFEAFHQPDGTVVLEWRTHEESRNLGFHIYRDGASGKQRITPSLVAGLALLLRGSKPQHAAKLYRWIDAQPSGGTAYWIEDVDINGTRTMHGPAHLEGFSAERAASFAAPVRSPPFLRELRASVATAPTFHGARPLARPRPIEPTIPVNIPRFTVADHAAVKIAVDHEGWYHVSFAQLIAAGLDSNSDVRSLHLLAEGVEQPLLLTTHSGNSTASSDGIEFYGTGIDTPFSDQRIYWLVRENQAGKRILSEPPVTSGRTSPASFPFSVIREDRSTYVAALLNGENNDNFFGAVVTSDPVDQELVTAHVDSTSSLPVILDVTLQGGTDQQDHLVSVQFNGASLGQMEFYGQSLTKQSFPVEPSLVQEASNTETLTALNGDNDVSAEMSFTTPTRMPRMPTGFALPLPLDRTCTADRCIFRKCIDSRSSLISQMRSTSLNCSSESRFERWRVAMVGLAVSGPAVRTILKKASDAVSSLVCFCFTSCSQIPSWMIGEAEPISSSSRIRIFRGA